MACTPAHTHTHKTTIFVEKPALFFCRLDFDVESFFPVNEDEEGFILTSSASKAGARVLTTFSKSDCCVRDWTAKVIKIRASDRTEAFFRLRSLHYKMRKLIYIISLSSLINPVW